MRPQLRDFGRYGFAHFFKIMSKLNAHFHRHDGGDQRIDEFGVSLQSIPCRLPSQLRFFFSRDLSEIDQPSR
ncbi:hypothetical protein XH97_01400 [Bradyrhizobium sp. CCBAU 53380]|nr:hypothetical protein [Bradyrhizobium sp. CCBAU 53380]